MPWHEELQNVRCRGVFTHDVTKMENHATFGDFWFFLWDLVRRIPFLSRHLAFYKTRAICLQIFATREFPHTSRASSFSSPVWSCLVSSGVVREIIEIAVNLRCGINRPKPRVLPLFAKMRTVGEHQSWKRSKNPGNTSGVVQFWWKSSRHVKALCVFWQQLKTRKKIIA